MWEKLERDGLTFDDVLLIPAKSYVLPNQVSTVTWLTRNISLNIPIVSAAMDTVTEARLAIALAREGGIGVIHRNLSVEAQAAEVDKVKRSQSGMIVDPITLGPDEPVTNALRLMEHYHISGVPITVGERLVGILTNRDIRFCEDHSLSIREVMTSEDLVTVPVGTTLEQAKELLHRHKIEKLPVVDEHFNLRGLITVKDIQKQIQFPYASSDRQGRLRAGAAIGVGKDSEDRAAALVASGVDVIVVDTAHGHAVGTIETVRRIKTRYSVDVIAGNIATGEAARDLIEAGADAIKVGVGPGSICTTRIVAGVGMPQITAIYEAAQAAADAKVPVVADGGIRYSGDIAKAIAAGADTVMVGSLFAGTDESPGDVVLYQGERFKEYRGMGSIGAMKERGFSKDRYQQEDIDVNKFVAEGIEGQVQYKGPITNLVYQLVGGLRSAMGYVGCASIEDMKTYARFVRTSSATLQENHPHDVMITKEAPNYWRP